MAEKGWEGVSGEGNPFMTATYRGAYRLYAVTSGYPPAPSRAFCKIPYPWANRNNCLHNPTLQIYKPTYRCGKITSFFFNMKCHIKKEVSLSHPVHAKRGGACGSVVAETLCLQDKRSRVRDPMRWMTFFSMYLILPAALGPGVHSASNRNEYQKQKNNVSVEKNTAGT
jgi:hypothetical protein